MDDIVNSVPSWMFTAIIVVCILFIIGIIFARLYRRASAEQAFVRTGLSGQKVVMSGGAIVMPIFHEIIPINMNTLKLEVSRSRILLFTHQADFLPRVDGGGGIIQQDAHAATNL